MSLSIPLPSTQKVVYHSEHGEYDVIKYDENYPTPQIESPNDIIIKNFYSGINFIEAYFRKGVYKASLPYIFGREASGEIIKIGSNVSNLKIGDKIAYLSSSTFAQYTKINNENFFTYIKLPSDSTDEDLKIQGSIYLQGLTALTFINEAYKVKPNDYILVWASAGGVGKILVQLISQIGANVIAIASTDEKLNQVKKLGAKYLINSSNETNIVEKVLEITNNKGVEATFDSIGKDTFDISFKSLARKGTFVSFGNSSGPVPPLSINILSGKNIKLIRPQLMAYIATPEEWNFYSNELLNLIEQKKLEFEISKVYDLKDYVQAAKDLESRKTTGKLTLKIPQ